MTSWPEGFGLVLDRSVRTFRQGTVLVGGHPGRVITLSDGGMTALAALLGPGASLPAAGPLARRLVEAGMAHPRPLGGRLVTDPARRAVVVVPVRDRSRSLDRCLTALGQGVPVVVVDDASHHPGAVAEVCRRHGAHLIRRAANGGPGAARNQALATLDCELVAFVDSDCTVTAGWLERLLWLFDDPEIVAVAPRVRPDRPTGDGPRSGLERFSEGRSSLDMGSEPGEVGPDGPVRYVPTAALVARRQALGTGFDARLRVGEDVDLVWRLGEEGRRVRYEPSVAVFHREPASWAGLVARRFRYGTSAAALAGLHPGRLAPVELRPGPTLAAGALLAGRPRSALVAVAVSAALLARQVRDRGVPMRLTLRWSAEGAGWTLLGLGRAATMLAGPGLVWGVRRGRRATVAVALLVLAPPVAEWWRRRPPLDVARWVAACVVDDVAYGAGVWAGCLGRRSIGPLVPSLRLPPRAGRACRR